MCRFVSCSIQDEVESCEDLLQSLRRKRISLQAEIIEKLINNYAVNMQKTKDSQRSLKRESFDIAKKRLQLKFDENGRDDTMRDMSSMEM